MRKNILITTLLILFINILSLAQYEKHAPCVLSNPTLSGQIKSGVIEQISIGTQAGSGLLATSTLTPSGKNPYDVEVKIKENATDEEKEEAEIAEIENSNASENWTCQYAAANVSDGSTATAWVEGVTGDGIGEAVISGQIDIKKPVKIWIGYGKSDALFKANNRPAKVRLYLLATNCPQASQYDTYYKQVTVIGTRELTLKDVNAYQPLALPQIKEPYKPHPCQFEEDNPDTYFIAVEILSVYKGSRYPDTCISEISN